MNGLTLVGGVMTAAIIVLMVCVTLLAARWVAAASGRDCDRDSNAP